MEVKNTEIKRGDIYYADLSPVVGSEQGGIRPVLVLQNDIGNKYSPTVIVCAITSQLDKAKLPTHIELDAIKYGLLKDSVVLLEQIRTIDKRRLKEKMGHLEGGVMARINSAIAVSFGLGVIPESYEAEGFCLLIHFYHKGINASRTRNGKCRCGIVKATAYCGIKQVKIAYYLAYSQRHTCAF